MPHRFVRCGVFYVQKPLADRAGLRILKSDANRAGFPGGVPGTGDLQAAESGLHSPARMRYTTLEVITMRRKFWLLAAVCLLVCLLAGCGSKEQTVTPDFVLTYADGTVEVVEVKSKFTRRQQRDYIHRRRMFIDLVAEPQHWRFIEHITPDTAEEIRKWKRLAEQAGKDSSWEKAGQGCQHSTGRASRMQ